MDLNGTPTNPSYVGASSPSAPPNDHFYPALNMDTKDYPNDMPPPYSTVPANSVPTVPANNVPPQGNPVGTPPQVYSQGQPHLVPVIGVTPAGATNQQVQAQPMQVVVQGGLSNAIPPGVCHLCRKGKIKNSATCCSWVACCILLPFGIIPGLIAFCYACRKPKCSRCGFIHGRSK